MRQQDSVDGWFACKNGSIWRGAQEFRERPALVKCNCRGVNFSTKATRDIRSWGSVGDRRIQDKGR